MIAEASGRLDIPACSTTSGAPSASINRQVGGYGSRRGTASLDLDAPSVGAWSIALKLVSGDPADGDHAEGHAPVTVCR